MDLENITQRIITGFVPVIFLGKLCRVYDPTLEDDYLASYYVKNAFSDILPGHDIMTNSDASTILSEKNLWNDKLEKELKALESDQSRIRKEIGKLKYKSESKKSLLKLLEANKKRCTSLKKQRDSLNSFTIEYLTKVEKHKYYLFLKMVDDSGKRIWSSIEDFENVDQKEIISLIHTCYFDENIDEAAIRKAARSDPWRTIWRCAVKTGKLFDCGTVNLTEFQRHLITWSLVYDNAYESPDCPEFSVIDNDDEFDAWLESQHNKRKNKSDDMDNINPNHNEVGVFVDSVEDAESVYNLNGPAAKARLRQRERELNKSGSISEEKFTDSQREIRMALNKGLKKA